MSSSLTWGWIREGDGRDLYTGKIVELPGEAVLYYIDRSGRIILNDAHGGAANGGVNYVVGISALYPPSANPYPLDSDGVGASRWKIAQDGIPTKRNNQSDCASPEKVTNSAT